MSVYIALKIKAKALNGTMLNNLQNKCVFCSRVNGARCLVAMTTHANEDINKHLRREKEQPLRLQG